ncbi:MAG: 6-carboxytetrahydropterin synthase [Chloroflexota bacterium]
MYRIAKQFHFSASHNLVGLPEGHHCARVHGHNYIVELILEAEALDETGFIIDFGDLKPFGDIIENELDHRHLNDVIPGPTSSENLACYLYQRAKAIWPEVARVRVCETPKLWAEYEE